MGFIGTEAEANYLYNMQPVYAYMPSVYLLADV
jgi:hypothetical protein